MRKETLFFLKPSMFKISVALLVFIVFAPFVVYDNGIRCIREPCPSINVGSIVNYFAFSAPGSNISLALGLLIFGIVVSYGVSCVIIELFSAKPKAKKRRK